MLTFARGNTSHGEQVIDVSDLLKEVERTVGPLRAETQTLVIAVPDVNVKVRGNPRVLASAIENLVVNALQSAGRDAAVRVSSVVRDSSGRSCESSKAAAGRDITDAKLRFAEDSVNAASDRTVCIEVTDNGPGVPEGAEARIFEPFFSGRTDGTGLGLAAAKSIIRAHRGDLELKRNTAGGACFKVSLPLLEETHVRTQIAERTLQ
jgi:two-component system sensor histidine kinase FlrB